MDNTHNQKKIYKKEIWKAGNMLYPLPAALITVSDGKGKDNIFTAAWVGTVCTNPPMLSVSVRSSRFSYKILDETKEFVVNLTTAELVKAVDYCGVRSGRDMDKFEACSLTKEKAHMVCAPLLGESPVSIECRVRKAEKLGSHTMFLSDVLCVHVGKELVDSSGKLDLKKAGMLVYSHGEYFETGRKLGSFGYSVRKKHENRSGVKKQKRTER